MADDRIKLGLNTGDASQQAEKLASSLGKVREAAQGVADTYELVAQAGSKADGKSFFDALGKGDAGIAPLEQAAKKTTEFQESLSRLDAVIRRVDDSETVFVTTAEEVAAAQRKQAEAAEKVQKAEMAQAIAVAYASATMQQEQEEAAQAAQAASDKIVSAAVRQTQAHAALREVTADLPNAFQRTVGVVKQTADATDDAAKKTGGFGRAALSASYAVQDFTSQIGTTGLAGALNAVQNNIPGLLTGLGAGAGLAGAISVVAVGAGLLYTNWDKLTKSWEDTAPKIPKLRSDLEGLGDALKGIKKQIDDLEEKSLTDVLGDPEKRRLADLKVAQTKGQAAAADQKLVEGIAREASPQTKALIEGITKAIGQAGGGEAVAMNLKENTGGTYREAVAVVAQALRGDKSALANLQRNAPTFGGAYDRLEAEADRKAQQFRDQQDQAQAKRLEDFQREADRINANKKARHDVQEEEIRQAGQSTPEELRQSEALEYLARNMGRIAPGLKLDNDEQLKVAGEMIRNRGAGMSAQAATYQALQRPRQQRVEAIEGGQQAEYAAAIDAGTGGAMNQDQLAEAAKRTQDLVKQGFSAQWAMAAVVRQMQAENQELAGQVAALNGFVGQLQQGQQVTRGRLRRNRR